MPTKTDVWWEVGQADSLTRLVADLSMQVPTYAIPFLDGFEDSEAILERLRADRVLPGLTMPRGPLVHAVVAKLLGFHSEAEAQFEAALAASEIEGFRKHVRTVAGRLGVQLSPPS
jgi:hypothetical protein